MMRYWRLVLLLVVMVGVVLLMSLDASAQCSMCRAALTGANNSKFLRSFNTGVLVLLVPPVTIFCSIFVVLRKHTGARDEHDPARERQE